MRLHEVAAPIDIENAKRQFIKAVGMFNSISHQISILGRFWESNDKSKQQPQYLYNLIRSREFSILQHMHSGRGWEEFITQHPEAIELDERYNWALQQMEKWGLFLKKNKVTTL